MKKGKKEKHFIKKAYYKGGLPGLRTFIKENLRYPKLAVEHKKEGTVHLKYSINHSGTVIHPKVISGIGFGCDEEAIRLVKLLKFEIPKNRSGKIIFHKTLQIHFKLSKVEEKKKKPDLVIEYTIVSDKKTGENNSSNSYSYNI